MKKGSLVWIIIVVVVIGVLAFITLNSKPGASQEELNMQNIEGVNVTILQQGTGDGAKNGDNVSMNYTGRLDDGKTFDSNIDPQFGHPQPFIFTLGAGQVIPGWDNGILGMKVGEKRRLEIEPEYAYGANGVGNIIPPNAKLIFEVELLSIN